jgi:predicted ATPase
VAQLERAAGLARDETPEQKLGKLETLLAPGAHGPEEIAVIAELLSLPNIAEQLNLTPQRKRKTLFDAFIHQLEAIVQQGPVLIIFEDVQWIDPITRELLEIIINLVSRMAVLLVITFRTEFQLPWTDQPNATVLTLSRLGARDGTMLVQELAGHVGLDREVIAEIVERTDGVPLFIEELTKAVLESGEHRNRAAATLAASPPAALAVPATLHASLIARLDRLGSVAKEIAQIGAVLGREFAYESIENVAQQSR